VGLQQIFFRPPERRLAVVGAELRPADDPHLHRVLAVGVYDLGKCERGPARGGVSRLRPCDRDPSIAAGISNLHVVQVVDRVGVLVGQPMALARLGSEPRRRPRENHGRTTLLARRR
jgi:hypothetical protein